MEITAIKKVLEKNKIFSSIDRVEDNILYLNENTQIPSFGIKFNNKLLIIDVNSNLNLIDLQMKNEVIDTSNSEQNIKLLEEGKKKFGQKIFKNVVLIYNIVTEKFECYPFQQDFSKMSSTVKKMQMSKIKNKIPKDSIVVNEKFIFA